MSLLSSLSFNLSSLLPLSHFTHFLSWFNNQGSSPTIVPRGGGGSSPATVAALRVLRNSSTSSVDESTSKPSSSPTGAAPAVASTSFTLSLADQACAPLGCFLAHEGVPAMQLLKEACESCGRIQNLQEAVETRHSRAGGHATQARAMLDDLLRVSTSSPSTAVSGEDPQPKRIKLTQADEAARAKKCAEDVDSTAKKVAKFSAKQTAEMELAHHYLARYAHLLCYANYVLDDECSPSVKNATSSSGYEKWLREHPQAWELFKALHALRLPEPAPSRV